VIKNWQNHDQLFKNRENQEKNMAFSSFSYCHWSQNSICISVTKPQTLSWIQLHVKSIS